jgi:hydrogenase/urease accessory protein HupE
VFNSIGRRTLNVVPAVCLLLLGALPVSAHNPGLSAAEVRIGGAQILVHLSISRSDVESVLPLDLDRDGRLTESDIAAATPRLEEFARHIFELEITDQRVAPVSAEVRLDQTDAFDFKIIFERGAGSRIRIRSAAIKSLARGHREYLSVVDERGNKLGEKMLDVESPEFELVFDRRLTTHADSVLPFLALGIEHILTGYDHLVFLLGLLLAGAGFRDVVKIITSFTAAHSITLALSTFDLVRWPSAVVEPLIAVSIIYVGLENVLRRELKGRWLLTFGFGLIHGFGFASALRELGVGSGAGAALPLVSFNAGVEIGQLVIAIVVLPTISKFRKRPVFTTCFVPACSILVSIAGGVWLVERMLG